MGQEIELADRQRSFVDLQYGLPVACKRCECALCCACYCPFCHFVRSYRQVLSLMDAIRTCLPHEPSLVLGFKVVGTLAAAHDGGEFYQAEENSWFKVKEVENMTGRMTDSRLRGESHGRR